MKIVAGLGNPGPKYETTRHNAGFLAVDRLIERWKATGPSNESEAEVYKATVRGEKVLLVKPQTYMNNSGRSIAPLFRFYKCAPADLVVIHDEVDLKPLALRIKTGGGTAGHNGLKSIDAHLGAGQTGYHRVRVGVGKPLPGVSPNSTADHVLQPFTDGELNELDRLLETIGDAVELLLAGDTDGAMARYNREAPDALAKS